MRILHVALGRHNPELEQAVASLGTSYHIIDWTTSKDVNEQIIKDPDYDLAFFHLQQKDVIRKDALKAIKGIKVNWTGDVRVNIEWYKEFAPHFNYTLFSNETDVVALKRLGLSSAYLQVGFQESIYNAGIPAQHPTPNTQHPITFMANNYGTFPLSFLRMKAILALRDKYKDQFGLYGSKWEPHVQNLNGDPHKEAAIYRASKVGISISHFDYERYYSDRMLRIMACGCFCLSYHYKGIEKDFTVGEHVDTFKSMDEMLSKIDHYLSDEGERQRIAQSGHDHVWNTCRWKHRMQDLKKIIGW